VKSSASFVHSLWERLHQFLRSLSLSESVSTNSTSGSASGSGSWSLSNQRGAYSQEWKTQVAVDLLDSLSESRLARVICSQVRP